MYKRKDQSLISELATWEILPYMAVFKSVHRTVDLGSSMDTFLCGQNCGPQQCDGHISKLQKLPDLGSFMDTFPTEYTKSTKNTVFEVLVTPLEMCPQNCQGPQFYGHF